MKGYEDDIIGTNQSDIDGRQASGSELPVHTCKDRATSVGAVIIGMKELLRVNGVDEARAALMVGRVAMDL